MDSYRKRRRALRKRLSPRTGSWPGRAGLNLATLATATCAGLLLTTPFASASSLPTPTTTQLVAMYNLPAVQFVLNSETATVTTYLAHVNVDKLVTAIEHNPATAQDVRSGDADRILADLVTELMAHPAAYLSQGAPTVYSMSFASAGTAWTVSSNGYLVTNHHVVASTPESSWISYSASESTTDTQAVGRSIEHQVTSTFLAGTGDSLTSAEESEIMRLASAWVSSASVVSNQTQSIHIGGGPNARLSDEGIPARVVSESPGTWPNADVAILKVHANNLPVIPLGNDASLQIGDPVYALGYPYVASFESGSDSNSTVAPTFSTGLVTNRLQSADGFSSIENSAPINHGSSGGPLVNAAGQVVGMVTAVDASSDSSSEINGGKFFYAIPVSLVRQYLDALGVVPTVSPAQAHFDQAMTYYQGAHYTSALNELQTVEIDGFSSPYVGRYVHLAEAAIRQGMDKPLSQSGFTWHLLGAVATLIVAFGAGALALQTETAERPIKGAGDPLSPARPRSDATPQRSTARTARAARRQPGTSAPAGAGEQFGAVPCPGSLGRLKGETGRVPPLQVPHRAPCRGENTLSTTRSTFA